MLMGGIALGDRTLWGLTDRARFALPAAIAAAVLMVITGGLALAAVTAVVVHSQVLRILGAGAPVWPAAVVGIVVALVVVRLSLRPHERALLRRVAAERVPPGAYPKAKHALAHVAVAAGIGTPPGLYTTPEASLNAFYVGTPGQPGYAICATEAVLELGEAEQRAIYANLISRSIARRTWVLERTSGMAAVGWLTLISLGGLADGLRIEADVSGSQPTFEAGGCWVPLLVGTPFAALVLLASLEDPGSWFAFVLTWAAPVVLAWVVTTGLLATTMGRAQVRDAHLGDGEGLLLTREPDAMIDALRWTEANWNTVPRCEAHAHLFWAWPGHPRGIGAWGAAGRLQRIEAVAGAAGLDAQR